MVPTAQEEIPQVGQCFRVGVENFMDKAMDKAQFRLMRMMLMRMMVNGLLVGSEDTTSTYHIATSRDHEATQKPCVTVTVVSLDVCLLRLSTWAAEAPQIRRPG